MTKVSVRDKSGWEHEYVVRETANQITRQMAATLTGTIYLVGSEGGMGFILRVAEIVKVEPVPRSRIPVPKKSWFLKP